MTTSRSRIVLPVLLAALVVVCGAVGLTTDHDALSSVLGAVTGAAAVLLLAVVVALLLERRRRRAERDRSTLDALEPLRGNGSDR